MFAPFRTNRDTFSGQQHQRQRQRQGQRQQYNTRGANCKGIFGTRRVGGPSSPSLVFQGKQSWSLLDTRACFILTAVSSVHAFSRRQFPTNSLVALQTLTFQIPLWVRENSGTLSPLCARWTKLPSLSNQAGNRLCVVHRSLARGPALPNVVHHLPDINQTNKELEVAAAGCLPRFHQPQTPGQAVGNGVIALGFGVMRSSVTTAGKARQLRISGAYVIARPST